MVGFSDVLLHFVHFLAVDVRVGVLRTVDHTGLQTLIHLGEAHFARVGAHGLELFLKYGRRLHPELQATGIGGHAQCLVGRQLLHPVVPIGQAGDVFAFHGLEQRLALRAQLEAVDCVDIVKKKGQVEQLHRLCVLLELGQ
ncbi:hypothetical protein D3C87_1300140 [compost metagenome]